MEEQRAEEGRPSKEYLNRPLLYPDLQDVWQAWEILSPRRNWLGGMSAAPLPISFETVDCYARRYGCSQEEFEDLLYLVARLDAVFIEDLNDRDKKRDDTPKDD